jgi:hypothetical protein
MAYLAIFQDAEDAEDSVGGPAEQEHRDHGQHLLRKIYKGEGIDYER